MSPAAQLDHLIATALDESGLEYEKNGPGSFRILLPGSKKLRTTCWLLVGQHGVLVEAFVCRRPEEAHEDVYRWLLRRNAGVMDDVRDFSGELHSVLLGSGHEEPAAAAEQPQAAGAQPAFA